MTDSRTPPGTILDACVLAGASSFLPLVLTRLPLVAFDSNTTPRTLVLWCAAVVVVGVVLGQALVSARARRVLAVAVGALLLGLTEIGTPGWVRVSVLTAVAATVALALASVAALDRLGSERGAGPSLAAVAAGAGLTVGLALSLWSPAADWSVSTATAGALCLAAGVFGITLPDPQPMAAPLDERRARRDVGGTPAARLVRRPLRLTAVLVGMWPMMADQIQADSAVGTRYPHLAVIVGGVLLAAVGGVGHLIDGRRLDTTSRNVQSVHVASALGGVAALAGVTSHSLIGAVTGWALTLAALGVAWVFAALAVSSDPDPVGRSVAITRTATTVALGLALGLLASSVAVPRHHTWWLTIGAIVVAHQAVRRLRRLPVEDVVETVARRTGNVAARRNERTLLDVARLESGYGLLQVLFSIDMTVERGEVLALLGPNGAGKTTLLRSIAGLHPTWSGRVQFGGVDLAGLDAAARVGAGLMLVSPESAVARSLSVDDNLRMFSHLLPVSEARAARKRVYETFPRLKERLRQSAATLSGGERQMLALSRALVLRPELLLIDEVTLGLSPAAIAELGPAIRQLNLDGTALVIVEQSTAVALSLASRALVLERGALMADFPAERLRERPDLVRQIHLEGIESVLATEVLS